MKSILISIKPEWVEKILDGSKTIEIRKTKPKCELPIKVYIYCTKGQELWGDGTGNTWYGIDEDEDMERVFELTPTLARLNGKVVAEFTLNKYDKIERDLNDWLPKNRYETTAQQLKNSCLTEEKLWGYGKGKTLYAWHIDDLIIYDTPKELSDFKKENKCHYTDCEEGCCCENCTFFDLKDCDGKYSKIYKAPESWCYVEEIGEEV